MATVLVLDDDPDILMLVRGTLEAGGHEVVTCSEPQQAAALAAEHRPDAAVLDIQMPDVSGYDVLRTLRAEPRTSGMPILFLSALSGSEDRVRGLREGADDFLTKPFAPEELQLRVERLVAKRLGAATQAPSAGSSDIDRSLRGRTVIGQLFLGRYQALEVVGEGYMGRVFRGWDPLLKRPVAIKTLRMADLLSDRERSELVSQLLTEAVTVARFSHPNIVMVYDVVDAPDLAFFVMEYVDGTSLADFLEVRKLPIEQVIPLATSIARGLGAAHEHQIVHHDVKPGNVLLGVDGSIKVTDFGVASLISSLANNSGKVFGTPGFLPPEALLQEPYSETGDLFGLGVILYQCLTGERPFGGSTLHQRMMSTLRTQVVPPRELEPAIPAAMERLVLDLLEKDPGDRVSSADEVIERLAAMAPGELVWRPDLSAVQPVLGERSSSPFSAMVSQSELAEA